MMAKITFPFMSIIKHYYCVFVGNPKVSTPYGLFASKTQAEIFQASATSGIFPIMEFTEWWEKYGEREEWQE